MCVAAMWRRLAVKCFFVLLPFWVIWIYLWLCPMSYVYTDTIHFLSNKWLTENTSKSYDVLILGDSTANASFVPEYLSETTVNLGLTQTTPIEAYYVLHDYLQNHPKPKVCFVSFWIGHMKEENGLYTKIFSSHRFSASQELEIVKQGELYNEQSIWTGTAYKDWLAYRLRLPNKYAAELISSFVYWGTKNKNLQLMKLLLTHRGAHVTRTIEESGNYEYVTYENYTVSPIMDVYYRKIFDLCNENGIQVYVVMTPICPNVRCTEGYQDTLYDYHGNIQKEFPNVAFFDRLEGFERKHLRDESHVNMHGALKFSKAIKRSYPDVFTTEDMPISRNTIDGMVDYLKMENYPSEILRRVENTDFSVLMIRWPRMGGYDKDLLDAVEECYPSMRKQVEPLSTKEGNDLAVFFVNGLTKSKKIEKSSDEFQILNASANNQATRFALQVEGTETKLQLPWEVSPLELNPQLAADMTAVILNHYDDTVVSVKNFGYSHGSYVLIP